MTPGDTLPPPSRPVEPPFSVGDVREVVHRLRGGFYNAFHGPPPDGGASRRWDGVVVVLVVSDPVGGAGRTRPLRGRVVTIGIPVQTRSVAGCQLLNQWIRGVNQDSAKFIKNQGLQSCIAFCATTSSRKRCQIWSGARASAALMSLGRTAERCASQGICWLSVER